MRSESFIIKYMHGLNPLLLNMLDPICKWGKRCRSSAVYARTTGCSWEPTSHSIISTAQNLTRGSTIPPPTKKNTENVAASPLSPPSQAHKPGRVEGYNIICASASENTSRIIVCIGVKYIGGSSSGDVLGSAVC